MSSRFSVLVVVSRHFRGAHYQPSVLHAFGADQAIRQLLHVPRLAPEHNHFETTVVVKMRM